MLRSHSIFNSTFISLILAFHMFFGFLYSNASQEFRFAERYYQPGTYLGEGRVIGNERTPRPIKVNFDPASASEKIKIQVKGRTSIGGFDKTMFLAIDGFSVTGLLTQVNRTLDITQPYKAVQSAGHHNWTDQYLADLEAAKEISSGELAQLRSRNIRYLWIRPISPEEAQERHIPDVWNIFVAVGLDASRKPKGVLGVLRLGRWQ